MNYTPFVRQYDILNDRWGFTIPKGIQTNVVFVNE